MASDNNENKPPSPQRRRSSFTEMFAPRPAADPAASSSGPPKQSAMASVMAQQQQRNGARRMSITTLGLSGSPTRPTGNPFDALKSAGPRTSEFPRSEGWQADENAVEDSDEVPPLNGEGSRPTSPSLGRRLSFGAPRSYTDARRSVSLGSGAADAAAVDDSSGSNTSPGGSKASSPPSARKDGFNWSETLRARAQRSSISAGSSAPGGFLSLTTPAHGRSASIAEPPPPVAPAPKAPPRKAPDHFQERILKGDFYMD